MYSQVNIYKILYCNTRKHLFSSNRNLSTRNTVDENFNRLNRSYKSQIGRFINSNPSILTLKKKIPKKFMRLQVKATADYLYLIDPSIAKSIASHITPLLDDENDNDHIICETNAGLGLIAQELLSNGIKRIRLYESCSEFRDHLKAFDVQYPGRVELFTKDIYNLYRYAYVDKTDNGNRQELMLEGVPKRSWIDNPPMTIIGPLPKRNFITFLIQSLVMQNGPISYGRIRLFPIMHPRDYAILTATPDDNLHTYQRWSILCNLLFDIKLLEKYPRKVFLPWESLKITPRTRYPKKFDPDHMYLVQIDFKKTLPVTSENLLAFYHFVTRFFGRGTNRVIPVLERFIPDCGLNIIDPKINSKSCFSKDMDIFTEFGELSPVEILHVFQEVMNSPGYATSPFMAMIDAYLMKSETIETSSHDAFTNLEKKIVEDIEHKLEKS